MMERRNEGVDAVVVWCGDPRCASFPAYLRELGLVSERSLLVPIFGGGWFLTRGEAPYQRLFLEQIAVAIERGAERVIVANHADCCWYERKHPGHRNDLVFHGGEVARACLNVYGKHPTLRVHGYVLAANGADRAAPREVIVFPRDA